MAAWARQRDTKKELRLVPFQEAPAPPMTDQMRKACEKAVHVVTLEGRVLRAGQATMFVLQRTGYPWIGSFFSIAPFSWLAELGYWIFAMNRWFFSRIFFTKDPDA